MVGCGTDIEKSNLEPGGRALHRMCPRSDKATGDEKIATIMSGYGCGFRRLMQHLDSQRGAEGLHMKYRTRIYYTETDKALMWERWRQGESLNAIARLFDRNHSAVGGILSRSGGMRPRPRRRSAGALALSEREEISRGAVAGLSVRAIARSLRRAPSTVS